MSQSKPIIGLFYGSTTCYTEMAAEKICEALSDFEVHMHNIKDVPLAKAEQYELLIFGISTWDFGELQEDWESQWDDIVQVNLSGKIIALFGLGDQIGYADWFQDALGMLHDVIITQDCHIIGYWENQGYDFAASKALLEGDEFFVGLSLDDENQYDLSEQRIAQWTEQLKDEINAL